MTAWQRAIKYVALAFAVFLCVSIIGGILGALSLISGLFGSERGVGNMNTYEVTGDISSLKIDVGAADFVILSGDAFRVESNLDRLVVEEKDGLLRISEQSSFWTFHYSGAKLALYIPADMVFEKVTFNSGAGKVTIEQLTAQEIDFDLGAGAVDIGNLTAFHKADIDGGAGSMILHSGQLNQLDFDMGVGEVRLTCAFSGSSTLNFGVGASTINLVGSREDYRINVHKGLGEVRVDGEKVSDGSVIGEGNNRLRVDGGIGEIEINFITE